MCPWVQRIVLILALRRSKIDMTLESQVCSLELAKKLKELGVKQKSVFYWTRDSLYGWQLKREGELFEGSEWEHFECDGDVFAFTVAELGEMLPARINGFELRIEKRDLFPPGEKVGIEWEVAYYELGYEDELRFDKQAADTEADARAKMLIYLIENKIMTV